MSSKMKGFLSGMNKFPGIVVMRKRRRGVVQTVSRKKVRKVQEQAIIKEDGVHNNSAIDISHSAGAEISTELTETEEDESLAGQLAEMPIYYDGDKATVTLQLKQMVALDGWAMVCLVAGRAAVHGYSLSPGVQVLVCSNSKLAAVVAIESQLSSPALETPLPLGVREVCLSSSKSSEISDVLEKPGDSTDTFGCTLQFHSYEGGNAETGPSLDAGNGAGSPSKRTFRIEVAGENDNLLRRTVIVKRKRDEDTGGGSSIVRNGGADEEEMTSSGDEEDEEENLRIGSESLVQGLVDMEVDDFLDSDNNLLGGCRDRKKQRKELRPPLNATVIPDSWWNAAKSILHQRLTNSFPSDGSESLKIKGSPGQNQRAQIVAVIGPKNAGKSTFAGFLLNFLLNSHEAVGYLDTDVGQPEFTVPGCLSLHVVREPIFGSPVLHLRNPERSFFYGDISPKGDPEMYSRSVGALFDYFQRKYGTGKLGPENDKSSVVPLVINTHGWIKGIGYDVLVDILRHTSPTHVVQLTSQMEHKNLPSGKFWESSIDNDKTTLVCIESSLEGGSSRPLVRVKTASDHLRDLRIMAYFRQCFSRNPLPYPFRENKLFVQTALGLVCHSPYQVSVSAVKIWHLHSQVPKSESFYSVNGAVVGLGVNPIVLDNDNIPARRLQSYCVGLGIVRGVDAGKGALYIITPLPADILQNVDTLLQGHVEIPVSLLQAKGYLSPYLCHKSVAIEGTGSVSMKPHKRFSWVAA